jgi:hypothetical protein
MKLVLPHSVRGNSLRVTAAIALATLASSASAAGYGATGASGDRPTSPGSLAQASTEIQLLNAQRQANGIPGDLQNVPELSQGCHQYTNEYEYDFSQYPHTELPQQKGYTVLGQRAAESSDLASGLAGMWGAGLDDDAWASAPLHLSDLFDPAARYAWYGSRVGDGGNVATTPYDICMGTGQGRPLAPGEEPSEPPSEASSVAPEAATPKFFSLPGDGVRDVPPAEHANEGPFTPGQAAHMPSNRYTGYNIILFDVGPDARLVSVTLARSGGQNVRVRVVGPDTRAPKSPAGWPSTEVVGDYSGNDRFVIPVQPLAGRATYELRALWAWSVEGHQQELTQRVIFTTSCTIGEADPFIELPRVRGCKHLSEVFEPWRR